jgi:glycosyltransferase involved in cell wall biosynthesis
MKVLQITAVDFTLKKFLIPLVDEMEKQGYEIHTACNREQIGEELQRKGYVIKHIPFERNLNVISHLKSLFALIKLIKKEKYDSIHAHTPVASIISRLAAKIAGVPLIVYTAHGFYFHENMKPLFYKIAYNIERIWGKYLTDYLFFQSKEDYELARQNKFNLPERLIHINNGVSGERFNPEKYNRNLIRKNMGFEDNDVVIMFTGRLVKEKGIQELLLAFNDLKKKNNFLKLMVVGGGVQGDRDGINIDELINSFSSEVKNSIHLLGLRDDIPELLSVADIFTLPSYREGLPRSIIEAMAMGKPVVATNIRGCREEVFPGVNGFLCKARDAKDLAFHLEKIITDKEMMSKLGSNSRELFLKEFEEQLVLDRQLEIFNRYRREKYHV